ncbi:hypothetical protein F5146DRAFT_1011186 [Armillaria mellea]|nr:hypothetical protein F5146DRAFT_1011186 [Armillaria mellea]
MSEQHAHVVYTKLLLARGHGYPLWIPEPDYTLPPEYIDKGICVGDVVIIRDDGGFDFLFNIFLEADHPINRDRVPPRFEPLHVSNLTTRTIYLQHGRRSSVTSSLVATHSIAAGGSASVPLIAGGGGGVEFTISKEQAAILVLPGGATRFDTNHPSLMRNYALEHAHEWYEFVNGPTQGREALNGSLVLVSGCDKAAAWGSAAMSRPSAEYSIKVTFSFPGVAEGQLALGSSWTTQLWTTTRLFPDVPGLAFDPSKENQGVFIRGFTISVRERKRVSKVLPVPWRSDVQLAKLSRPLPNISSKAPYSLSPPISGPAWGTQGTSDRGYLQKDDLTKLISSIVESHLDDVENPSLSSPSTVRF